MLGFLVIVTSSSQANVLEPLFSRAGGIAGRNISLDFGGKRLRNPSLLFSLPATTKDSRLSIRRLAAFNSLTSLLRSSPHLSHFAFDMSRCSFTNFLSTPIALRFAEATDVLTVSGQTIDGKPETVRRGDVCKDCPTYGSATISNCKFSNCKTSDTLDKIFKNGGALGFENAYIIRIEKCTFTSCSQSSATACADPGCGGGAVYVGSSDRLVLSGSSITSCSADCGGGVWTYRVSSVEIDNTKMVECSSSKKEGGGLRCDEGSYRGAFVSFQSCTTTPPSTGGSGAAFNNVKSFSTDTNATSCSGGTNNGWGAFRVQDGTVEIHFSKFISNQGAVGVLLQDALTVDLSRTAFIDQTADTDLYLYTTRAEMKASLDHICFQRNSYSVPPLSLAQQGGSLTVTMSDSYFSGSLVYATETGSVAIETQNVFTNAHDSQCDAHTPTLSVEPTETFSATAELTDDSSSTSSSSSSTETTSDTSSSTETTSDTSSSSDTGTGPTSSSGTGSSGVTTTPGDEGNKGDNNIGVIVGSVIAVILVIVIVTLVVMCCMWRCRKSAVMKDHEVSDMDVLAFPTV